MRSMVNFSFSLQGFHYCSKFNRNSRRTKIRMVAVTDRTWKKFYKFSREIRESRMITPMFNSKRRVKFIAIYLFVRNISNFRTVFRNKIFAIRFVIIRSSHKFVPFFERLYMLRLFTYLSVSWKNVMPLSLYNFFPFFKCIGPLSPYVYKSTHEMYTQKSARTYGMT